ncbi:RTA1 like protein-domain-containing protein [Xylariales sp. PMI_506]|nr:RTA1 like protein-domain-containing protein [Xylariales sp. PMI_506]
MSLSTLPDGLISFGPDANCTLAICPLEWSILEYQPSIPANSLFLALFSLSMAIQIGQAIKWKTWGFLAGIVSGCVLEIIGYVGRLMIHNNPFDFNGFVIQIVCITIAPVFFCGAIYVMLSRTINHIDPSISRFKPKVLYSVFIPCDIVSLILQAVGGALSCVSTTFTAIERGTHISLAGLVFQVATLVVFCAIFVDYLIACARVSPGQLVISRRTRVFLGFLFAATTVILIRCIYRIVELKDGYFSATFRDEGLFIGLESAMMCLAVFLLNIAHPGPVFTPKLVKSSI